MIHDQSYHTQINIQLFFYFSMRDYNYTYVRHYKYKSLDLFTLVYTLYDTAIGFLTLDTNTNKAKFYVSTFYPRGYTRLIMVVCLEMSKYNFQP